jgi:hypothetical protein
MTGINLMRGRLTKTRIDPGLMVAGVCLLCAIAGWMFSGGLEGSEFSGGRITGPLLGIHDLSSFVFLLAFGLTFRYRRAAAAVALVAALLSLPLYLYFIAPGPFRALFPGPWNVLASSSFVWNTAAIAAILLVGIAAGISVRTVRRPGAEIGATV